MILRYTKYKIAQGENTISSVDIEDNLPNIDTILEQMIHYNNKWLPLYFKNFLA